MNMTYIETKKKKFKSRKQNVEQNKGHVDKKVITKQCCFTGNPQIVLNESDIEPSLEASQQNIIKQIEKMEKKGWKVKSVIGHTLHVDPLYK